MPRGVEGGSKGSFVETQTGLRGPFSVEVDETGFDRDKEEDFTTLRVSMIKSYMTFDAYRTELDALLNGIDKSAIEFGSKTQSGKWTLVPKIDPLGWEPYLKKRFAFRMK